MGETRQAIPTPNVSWEELKDAIEYAVSTLNERLNRRIQCGHCELIMGNDYALVAIPTSPFMWRQTLRIELAGDEVVGILADGPESRANVLAAWHRAKRLKRFLHAMQQALAGNRAAVDVPVLAASISVRGSLPAGVLLLVLSTLFGAALLSAALESGSLADCFAFLFFGALGVVGLGLIAKALKYKYAHRK